MRTDEYEIKVRNVYLVEYQIQFVWVNRKNIGIAMAMKFGHLNISKTADDRINISNYL